MTGIYSTGSDLLDSIGVQRIINGRGWITALGGSIMPPEVVQAMNEAVDFFVDLHELNIAAGRQIAHYTGAEAGLVVAGAGAGLLLQTAACIAGSDEKLISRLPDTRGLKNEVLLYKDHWTGYSRCYRAAGAKVVVWGKGGAEAADQLRAAINDRTVAVAYVFHPWNSCPLSLKDVVGISHEHGLPVIVDAAVMLPPVDSLTRYIDDGADMVTFSGGKGLRGPQSTGILCGRADLVEAARLNMSPYAGIGRPAKVCKEEIVGLLAALKRFVTMDHEAEWAAWRAKSETIAAAVSKIRGVDVHIEEHDFNRQGPQVVVYFKPGWNGPSSEDILDRLAKRSPSVRIGRGGYGDELFVTPVTLRDGDEKVLAQALQEELLAMKD